MLWLLCPLQRIMKMKCKIYFFYVPIRFCCILCAKLWIFWNMTKWFSSLQMAARVSVCVHVYAALSQHQSVPLWTERCLKAVQHFTDMAISFSTSPTSLPSSPPLLVINLAFSSHLLCCMSEERFGVAVVLVFVFPLGDMWQSLWQLKYLRQQEDFNVCFLSSCQVYGSLLLGLLHRKRSWLWMYTVKTGI